MLAWKKNWMLSLKELVQITLRLEIGDPNPDSPLLVVLVEDASAQLSSTATIHLHPHMFWTLLLLHVILWQNRPLKLVLHHPFIHFSAMRVPGEVSLGLKSSINSMICWPCMFMVILWHCMTLLTTFCQERNGQTPLVVQERSKMVKQTANFFLHLSRSTKSAKEKTQIVWFRSNHKNLSRLSIFLGHCPTVKLHFKVIHLKISTHGLMQLIAWAGSPPIQLRDGGYCQ